MKEQMKTRKEGQERRLKRRELGKIMMIHPLAHYQRKMEKLICV